VAQRPLELEAVSRWDRYPPGVDLGRAKLAELPIAEHRDRLREQPAQDRSATTRAPG
jgi:hypothetical protein